MPEHRTIVVTGATRGLGRAMVAEFAERDHVVAGCGRNAERVAALRDTFPSPHRFDVCDVADDESVAEWAQSVLAEPELGAPDLLLNNAGMINANAPLWEVSTADFDRVLAVNVCGVANVIRHFLPAMIARGRGVVVNFSSGWGRSTSPEVAPYCAAKWAIEGLSQALAQELPRGLASVALNPGVIDTEMLRSCWSDAAGGCQKPDAWAKRAVPFLLELGPEHNGEPVTVP